MASSSSSSFVFAEEGEKLKRNLIQAADIRPCLRNHGEELIGCRINVFSPILWIHSAGTITSFNRLQWRHQVDYEDGGRESLDLSKEIWELVDYENLSNSVFRFGNTLESSSRLQTKKKHMIAIGRALTLSEKETHLVYTRKSRSYLAHGLGRHFFNTSKMGARREYTYYKNPRLLGGPSSDLAEGENLSNKIEEVFGHKVTASLAPILWFLYAKYGDFAANSLLKMFPDSNTSLLEIVCDVVIKLTRDDFGYVLSELSNMMLLADVASMGQLDVSWLKKVLAEIDDVRKFTVRAATKDFDARKKVMMMAKKRFKKIQRSFTDLGDIYHILKNTPVPGYSSSEKNYLSQ